MKKAIAFICVLTLCFSLCACGKTKESEISIPEESISEESREESASESGDNEQSKGELVFVAWEESVNTDTFIQTWCGFRDKAAELGYTPVLLPFNADKLYETFPDSMPFYDEYLETHDVVGTYFTGFPNAFAYRLYPESNLIFRFPEEKDEPCVYEDEYENTIAVTVIKDYIEQNYNEKTVRCVCVGRYETSEHNGVNELQKAIECLPPLEYVEIMDSYDETLLIEDLERNSMPDVIYCPDTEYADMISIAEKTSCSVIWTKTTKEAIQGVVDGKIAAIIAPMPYDEGAVAAERLANPDSRNTISPRIIDTPAKSRQYLDLISDIPQDYPPAN